MGIPTLEKFFFSIGRSGHAPQVSDAHPLSFYSFSFEKSTEASGRTQPTNAYLGV
jgi:hypothetical protein